MRIPKLPLIRPIHRVLHATRRTHIRSTLAGGRTVPDIVYRVCIVSQVSQKTRISPGSAPAWVDGDTRHHKRPVESGSQEPLLLLAGVDPYRPLPYPVCVSARDDIVRMAMCLLAGMSSICSAAISPQRQNATDTAHAALLEPS
jgi:hypothetical protein